MKNTSNRLKELMKERGLKQVDILNMSKPYQKKLEISMSKSHLSQYVNGKSNPDQRKLYLLAMTLNVSEAWLMGYDVEKDRAVDVKKEANALTELNSVAEQLIPARQKHVISFAKHQLDLQEQNENKIISLNTYRNEHYADVIVQGYTSAGTGETLLDDVSFSVQVKGYIPSHDIALQVNGDSMEPLFEDKEIIYIEKTTEINSGQIGVFIIDGEAYVKKVFVEDDRIRLVSLNKKYEDLYFYDNQGIEIVGKVIL